MFIIQTGKDWPQFIPTGTGGGLASLPVLQAGVLIGLAQQINFTGTGVAVTVNGVNPNQIDIAIAGNVTPTLQLAYNGGSIITETIAGGPVTFDIAGVAGAGFKLLDGATTLIDYTKGTTKTFRYDGAVGATDFGFVFDSTADLNTSALGYRYLSVMSQGTEWFGFSRASNVPVFLETQGHNFGVGSNFTGVSVLLNAGTGAWFSPVNGDLGGGNSPWGVTYTPIIDSSSTSLTVTTKINSVAALVIDGLLGGAFTKGIGLFGLAPPAQSAAIADAAGGATIDAQARTAINTLLAYLRVRGDVHV